MADDLIGLMRLARALSEATFQCTNSGECCRGFETYGVPGYDAQGQWTGNLQERGRKPALQDCHHLEPARIIGGKWQSASCGIHDDPELYPAECRRFTFGFGSCALGMAIWKHRKGRAPTVDLPSEESLGTKSYLLGE